jgi:hypothetical protein
MNWKKGILFGLLVWVIMFVVVSIFVAFKMPSGALLSIIMIIISAITVYVVAGYLSLKKMGEALEYGTLFAVIGIILDFIISQRFAPGMFSSVYYWLSYLLVILVPMLRVKKEVKPIDPKLVDPA